MGPVSPRLVTYARRLASMPIRDSVRAAIRITGGIARRAAGRRRDRRHGTYGDQHPGGALASCFGRLPIDALEPADIERIAALSRLYLEHRFDLLGSGWVSVHHGARCEGVEGHVYPSGEPVQADDSGRWLAGRINDANLSRSRAIWRLVDSSYRPIDWHLDFKSGFRWRESTWAPDIMFAHLPGVDVKVPWELARMQHLPHLAWAHALAGSGAAGFEHAHVYAHEFRNQVLDFIATNPPRFGVNWTMNMDVAIRAASLVVSYDLFTSHGAAFDDAFANTLLNSVYDHGSHIVRHLEWHGGTRANHYLANVAGLLFTAAYLPRSPQVDAWLAFAIQELVSETEHQFRPDGANFEDSTPYHRLSAEMIIYGTALVLGLPESKQTLLGEYDAALHRGRPKLRAAPMPLYPLPGDGGLSPFPAWFIERLQRMAEFTIDVTKPTGAIHQVGDNDNGRFLKLWPEHGPGRRTSAPPPGQPRESRASESGWSEDSLDHRHLISAINGLFDREDFRAFSAASPEHRLVAGLASGPRFAAAARSGHDGGGRSSHAAASCPPAVQLEWSSVVELLRDPDVRMQERVLRVPGVVRNVWQRFAYPCFGLYIMRAPGVYLAIRCGGKGQARSGAHAHNDQLALEFSAGETQLFRDPGTYLYTPLPGRRNAYRSALAHFVPRGGMEEPVRFDRGLFYLGEFERAECLYFGPRGFAGVYRGYDRPVYRLVELDDELVRVMDAGAGLLQEAPDPPPFSPGYGLRDV